MRRNYQHSVRSHSLVFKMICKYGLTTLHSHYGWLELLPPGLYMADAGQHIVFFIFTISHRHDIISNEIRTNFTVNFVVKEKTDPVQNSTYLTALMLFIMLHFRPEAVLLFWCLHCEIHGKHSDFSCTDRVTFINTVCCYIVLNCVSWAQEIFFKFIFLVYSTIPVFPLKDIHTHCVRVNLHPVIFLVPLVFIHTGFCQMNQAPRKTSHIRDIKHQTTFLYF